MRTRPTLLSVLVLVAVPVVASAAEPVLAAHDTSARLHDGFYMRLATGFGSHFETIQMHGHDPGVTVSGLASVGEFALGYAFRPGWVFGLGSYSGTLIVTSRSFDIDQPMPPTELLNDVKDFNVFGPFVDHYFDARRGLHAQAALGVATVRGVSFAGARFDEEHIVVGAGLMLGLGYEWWVADQWSLGLLGRLAVAGAATDDHEGVRWEHGMGASPSLLFTATFN